MNAANPLDQLKPNHLPDPIGLWPLATGWWIALGVGILLCIAIAVYIYRRKKQRRYRLQALQQAELIHQQFHNAPQSAAQAYNELLKRVALHAYATSEAAVAGLSGDAWCQFLADSASMPAFIEHSAFNHVRYAPSTELNEGAIFILTQQWIKNHRRSLPATLSTTIERLHV